ncbi:hypothetical protein [Thalassobacillus sp. CUG 92003]|uniref:hypothetical protein n=1 Tax=Thalassobacillus sp. CUG 92003 TaxID=2736641 RepID=UPI0015E76F16|nr:hypothetical protein [Thalassobacillus sp. CUG 92003]
MDDKERDAYLLEILDRLARLETKLDDQGELKETAKQSLELGRGNSHRIDDVERRLDNNDKKWDTDRSEKKAMWIAFIGGIFAVAAAIAGSAMMILFN